MLSRRAIFALSVAVTVATYAMLLWLAPYITLIEADRLSSRITTQFRVAFLDAPPPSRDTASDTAGDGMPVPGAITSLFGEATETISIADSLTTPPLETPHLAERLAAETPERAHDLAREPERARIVDTRVIEIAAADARRDINVPRRIVRPSPEYTLPLDALPTLRSRDPGPQDIALEPARIGAGLLAQALPMQDDAPDAGAISEERPPFEDFDSGAERADDGDETTTPAAVTIEQTVMRAPVERETGKARAESAYTFLDDMVDIRLETYAPSSAQPGYFRLRILPRDDAAITPLPRDVVFILDASRSMQQRKLELVGRGIADALEEFRPDDRFNIMLFRDTVTMFQSEPVYATPDNIAAAQAFLSDLEARGQTDVYSALTPVAQMTPRPNLPGIVLVASDGVPTTGLRDSRAIINAITADNALRNSIFAYGAGGMVDRYLLDLLAYRNKGEAFVSSNIQDARSDIAAFIGRLEHPILVNLKAEYGRVVREEVFPDVIPDFYREKPVVLYGRFNPGGDETFVARITGRAGAVDKELVFRAALSEAERGGVDIAQGWAFEKAYHLIGEISRRGEQPELLDALRRLSRDYRIRTIYDE